MSGLSQQLREAVMRASVGGPALALTNTPAQEVWLALLSAQALDSQSGLTIPEVTYPGYGRVAVPYERGGLAMWGVEQEGSVLTNLLDIACATLLSGSQLVLGWALLDQPTEGSLCWSGTIPHGIVLTTDDPTPTIAPGIIKLNLASGI